MAILKKESHKTFVTQAIKFGLVGIPNTLIGMGTFAFLVYVCGIHYIVSNVISTALALLNSYLMNKYWTFKSAKHSFKEIVKFIIVFFMAFALQNTVLIFLKEHYHMKEIIAYIIAAVIYTGSGFLGNRCITFRKTNTLP